MRFLLAFLTLGFVVLLIGFVELLPPRSTPSAEQESAQQQPTITEPFIRADDPRRGNPAAPITLIEFSDFTCPSCKRFQTELESVRLQFPDRLFHVWKDFPLPNHPYALPAHVAARCAGEQGKFWEYHDRLFAEPALTPEDMKGIAADLKLDTTAFQSCAQDPRITARIQENFNEGLFLGITETPTFFINNERITGFRTAAELRGILEKILIPQ